MKKNMKKIIIGSVITLLLFGIIVYTSISNSFHNEENFEEKLLATTSSNEEKIIDTKIRVEVKGEVVSPGVYELDRTSRLQDLVTMAGGFNKNAYYDNINLSRKLKDEMVLVVYNKNNIKKINKNVGVSKKNESTSTTKPSEEEKPKVNDVVEEECEVKDYDIKECLEKEESVISTEPQDKVDEIPNGDNSYVEEENNNSSNNSSKEENNNSSNNSSKEENNCIININTAGIKELSTLSGIGAAKAQKIIDYREANGNFKTIEEIMNVKGIGKATYEKFKANIKV